MKHNAIIEPRLIKKYIDLYFLFHLIIVSICVANLFFVNILPHTTQFFLALAVMIFVDYRYWCTKYYFVKNQQGGRKK